MSASLAQQSRTLLDLDSNQEIILTATVPSPKEVEDPEAEISDLSREVISLLDGQAETTKDTSQGISIGLEFHMASHQKLQMKMPFI